MFFCVLVLIFLMRDERRRQSTFITFTWNFLI